MRSQFAIPEIPFDPRLNVTGEEVSVGEILARWTARARFGSAEELARILRALGELRTELKRITSQKLDDGLRDLLTRVTKGKYTAALSARWGWDGSGGCTLEEAAKTCSVSRERIRQVEGAALKTIRSGAYVPALEPAIALLADAAAAFEPDVANLLMTAGLTSRTFKPYGILTAAKILGKTVDFEVAADGLTVYKIGDDHFALIREAFKSLANVNYVASVAELHARIHDLGFGGITEDSTRHLLARHPRAVWLDRDRHWFWLQQQEGRNRYVNAARKVLAVVPRVRVDILRDGVLRQHRSRGMSLPRHIFEGLCRAAGFEIAGDVALVP